MTNQIADYNILITAAALILCLLVLWRNIIVQRKASLHELSIENLKKELQTLRDNEKDEQDFQNRLKHAEVSTELHKSRYSNKHKNNKFQAPERYGYVLKMFQSGLQCEKIASSLGMSCQEINQLLKMAEIRLKNQG